MFLNNYYTSNFPKYHWGVVLSVLVHLMVFTCLFVLIKKPILQLPKERRISINVKIKSKSVKNTSKIEPETLPTEPPAKSLKQETLPPPTPEITKHKSEEPKKPQKTPEPSPTKPKEKPETKQEKTSKIEPKPEPKKPEKTAEKPIPQPTKPKKPEKPDASKKLDSIISKELANTKPNPTKPKETPPPSPTKSMEEDLLSDLGDVVKNGIKHGDENIEQEIKDIKVAEAINTLKEQIDRCWQKVLYNTQYSNQEVIVNYSITFKKDGTLDSYKLITKPSSTIKSQEYEKATQDAEQAINLCKNLQVKPNPNFYLYWKTLEYKFSTTITH